MSTLKLGDYLRLGEVELRKGPHPGRAHNDAELLLCSLLGRNRAWLIANRQADLYREQLEAYSQLLSRRAAGEPIQYIVGETEFYGLPFHVTREVLIPRPETEHLVEKVLELLPLFSPPRIVDVGTGSGAIAIALAHEWPSAVVTSIDVSSSALELARRNAARNGFADRIRFLEGDLLAPVAGEQFDVVVSNPPYVATVDRETLAAEVREHEPAVALFAGDDGLDVIRRLIPEALAALVSGGYLLLEIGQSQSGATGDLLASAGYEAIEFVPDLQGIPRVAVARRP